MTIDRSEDRGQADINNFILYYILPVHPLLSVKASPHRYSNFFDEPTHLNQDKKVRIKSSIRVTAK